MCFCGFKSFFISIIEEIHNSPVNVLSIFHSAKENNAGKRVAEEKEKHAHDDEEALVHADDHSQQQHLQCHLITWNTPRRTCHYYDKTSSNWKRVFINKTYSHASHILWRIWTQSHMCPSCKYMRSRGESNMLIIYYIIYTKILNIGIPKMFL